MSLLTRCHGRIPVSHIARAMLRCANAEFMLISWQSLSVGSTLDKSLELFERKDGNTNKYTAEQLFGGLTPCVRPMQSALD